MMNFSQNVIQTWLPAIMHVLVALEDVVHGDVVKITSHAKPVYPEILGS